jgi:hypothetical protein
MATAYEMGAVPVLGRGLAYSADELDTLLDRASELLWDDVGTEALRNLLQDLPRTQFESDRLEQILGPGTRP